ncbi:MAG: putative metal-binding motif-containing protein, partial [Candidatus Uhrbacteria bacterium]|nr:putative metal-binding motif-containing protein [Candidatus Uhrbacteria bacterium]
DTYGDPAVIIVDCATPTGYVFACDVQSLADFADAVGGDSANLVYWIQPTFYEDTDGDGYEDVPMWDCDDQNEDTYPGATEICDGADNDCDDSTAIDDGMPLSNWYADVDLDTYGDPAVIIVDCATPTGYVADGTDCDDSDANINPDMLEVCDELNADENCDGTAEESGALGEIDWYTDADDDGYGTGSASSVSCDGGTNLADNADDCDDTDDTVSSEITWYSDYDADGFGSDSVSYLSCTAPTDYIATNGDCDDSSTTGYDVNPDATEVYDGIDNDCDGSVDEDVTCDFRVEIFGASLTSVTADFSDDEFDGDWVSGVAGIGLVSTSLGGDVWYHEFSGDYCFGSETLDVAIVFTDGTVACDAGTTAGSGTVFATQDGGDLVISNVDNGDGTCTLHITE